VAIPFYSHKMQTPSYGGLVSPHENKHISCHCHNPIVIGVPFTNGTPRKAHGNEPKISMSNHFHIFSLGFWSSSLEIP
jgi:hypothetical protein